MEEKNDNFGFWGILELMGHRQLAGYVTEEERFGSKMCRIDIPISEDKFFTQYYGGSSIYCLSPVEEEVARAYAARKQSRPVSVYELDLPKKSSEMLEEGIRDIPEEDFSF